MSRPLENGFLPDTPVGDTVLRRFLFNQGDSLAQMAGATGEPAVAYTSDFSRPGFERMGFVPTLRFTLWHRV